MTFAGLNKAEQLVQTNYHGRFINKFKNIFVLWKVVTVLHNPLIIIAKIVIYHAFSRNL